MARKPLIAGNWKMNQDVVTGVALAKELQASDVDYSTRDVLVAPSYAVLYAVAEATKGSNLLVSAQNMYFENSGAYTGEVSASMIKSCGVEWVILGHSERRAIFMESDEVINKKVLKALSEDMKVILCVGETLEEREAGKEYDTVLAQVTAGIKDVSDMANVVIAYEPVWAIGTGKTASSADAEMMHKAIREHLVKICNSDVANSTRILYGGSVKGDNAAELMSQENIDGALVGGASLKAEEFLKIINFDK